MLTWLTLKQPLLTFDADAEGAEMFCDHV